MRFRITILCENSVGPLLSALGEHGFSALVEPAAGDPLLFDTGQGRTLLHNARCMNRNLALVRQVVISHGHYDHAGGLLPLLQECGPKRVLAHPGIFVPRYRLKDTGESMAIGIPESRETLEREGASFELEKDFRPIAPHLFLTGEVPRVIPFETGDCGLFQDTEGLRPDATEDDQSLVLETEKGLVVLLGCCHAGVVNTLKHVADCTGRDDFHAIIGGTHLGFCSAGQLRGTVHELKRLGISRIAAGHCTGFAAACRLAAEMPKAYQQAMVGYTIEL